MSRLVALGECTVLDVDSVRAILSTSTPSARLIVVFHDNTRQDILVENFRAVTTLLEDFMVDVKKLMPVPQSDLSAAVKDLTHIRQVTA